MSYTMKGTVKVVLEEQTFASGFNKREFVVTTEDDKYPQDICFETVKDRTAMLDRLNPGDGVVVSFDVRGREYNGKYYTNLNAWKIEGGSGSGQQQQQQRSDDIHPEGDIDFTDNSPQPAPAGFDGFDDDDDIPF